MEVLRALAALCEPPGPESARLASLLELGEAPTEEDWSDLFVFQLPPYASIYLGADGRIGGEARDRIAGFWRALGLDPPAECDHLAVMLAFYAELGEHETTADDDTTRRRWHHARSAFFWEHLSSWLPPYLTKLGLVAPPFFHRWGALVGGVLGAETQRLPSPPEEPLHWRQAPVLADPRVAGSRVFLESLLTPLASGLLLTRADLERAARELGLALRVGERRFLLETLLAQEPAAVLAWLEDEGKAWHARLAAPRPNGPATGSLWLERAVASIELLTTLAAEAG